MNSYKLTDPERGLNYSTLYTAHSSFPICASFKNAYDLHIDFKIPSGNSAAYCANITDKNKDGATKCPVKVNLSFIREIMTSQISFTSLQNNQLSSVQFLPKRSSQLFGYVDIIKKGQF